MAGIAPGQGAKAAEDAEAASIISHQKHGH
jgi:hypothetical protein